MTVKELKQLLEGVDDNLLVLIPMIHNEFDGRLYSPSVSSSGLSQIGGDIDMDDEEFERQENLGLLESENIFLLCVEGFGEEQDNSHQLN